MNTQELIVKMKDLVATIEIENSKSTKKAHNLARKASSELKQLAAEFKRQSTAEDKASK